MKSRIEVSDRGEGELIAQGLLDPHTRALVKVMGALKALPSDHMRRSVLAYVTERLDDDQTEHGNPKGNPKGGDGADARA